MVIRHKDKERLDRLVSELSEQAIMTYVDCYIYLTSHLRKNNTFIFRYSAYAIQERLIIAVKKLIEPVASDRHTMFSIGKIIEQPDFCDNLYDKEGIKYIYTDRLNEIFNSDHAKRLKSKRDALCHNCGRKETQLYCKDLMNVLTECLDILADVREQILNQPDVNYGLVKDLAYKFSQDYWNCIIAGAKNTTITDNDLKTLASFTGNSL